NPRWVEVVGVSRTGKYRSVVESPQPFIYVPFSQWPRPRMALIAETLGDPAAMAGPLREVIRSIDASMPIFSARTMEDVLRHGGVAQLRVFNMVFSVTGLMGLLLAVIGLYALVAFQVGRRTREIGIRMALGAERLQVLRMVLRQAGIVSGFGIAAGLAL